MASVLICVIFYQYSWEPMFVHVFAGTLFAFVLTRPQFALLFALPPSKRPEEQTANFFLYEIIARPAGFHRYLAREFVALAYLLQYIFYFLAVRKELTGILLFVLEVELYFY